MKETELRQQLVHAYQRLVELGLTEQSSGNVSIRTPDGMLISPSGASAESISAANVVQVKADGSWQGLYKPSSEWQMHAAIYQAYPQAEAVVHTHSDHCVALSCQRRVLPGFHYLVGTFGGTDVRCTDYFTFGTEALADAAVEALSDRTACLLGSHGMIGYGDTVDTAVETAHRLELLCRQYLLAAAVGEPATLSDSEWQEFFSQFNRLEYGKQE